MATSSWAELQGSAATGGAVLPDGPYNVYVDQAKADVASTGKQMITVRFRVADGPHVNQTVYNNFVLSDDNPNALGFFFEHLAALGADQAFFAAIPPPAQGGMDAIANRIMGQYATVTVGHKQWQGRTRNVVGDIKPYGGVGAAAGVPAPPPVAQAQVPVAPVAQLPVAPQAPVAPVAPVEQSQQVVTAPPPPQPPGAPPVPQAQPQQPPPPAAPF